MNTVQQYAHIDGWRPGDGPRIDDLRKIESMARISHRSEDAQTDDSWKRFIDAVVVKHGDWSVVEHVSTSVMAYVDRGVQQEWTRHRLFSFTIESTRFVNYDKKMPASFIRPPGMTEEQSMIWDDVIAGSEEGYKKMIRAGAAPQIARSVFPLGLGSLMGVTSNLRNWRHMFIMRTTKEAHPQYREVAIPLRAEFQEAYPILFDDIVPMQRQIDNLRLPR